MGKLGKIMAPVAAVLAIALAALSFLVNDGFKKYQSRANNLAETVKNTAQKLDAGSGTSANSSVSFTAAASGTKESGKLAYAEYKKDKSSFEKNTGNVVKLAGDVIAQRDELSEAIASMTQALGIPADTITAEELNTIAGYKELASLAKSYVEAFKKHDDEVVKAFQDAAKLAGANNAANAAKKYPTIAEQEVSNSSSNSEENSEEAGEESSEEASTTTVKMAKYDSQDKSLAQLKANIEVIVKRKTAYEAAIKNLQKVLTAYKLKANVAGISGGAYEKILVDLAADMAAINAKLKELDAVKAQLRQKEEEIETLTAQNNELKKSIEDKNATIKELQEKMAYYGIGGVKKANLKSRDEVNPEEKGQVILENKEWNYVIADLGKTQVFEGIDVVISVSGKYIASGVIKKVEEEICLIEITRRVANDIPKGATVLMGRNVISTPAE